MDSAPGSPPLRGAPAERKNPEPQSSRLPGSTLQGGRPAPSACLQGKLLEEPLREALQKPLEGAAARGLGETGQTR